LNGVFKTNIEPKGPEINSGNDFQAYIEHRGPEVPIAMVCRRPFGKPNNADVFNPQAEAWLSCIRNAKTSVFIQTPDLNADLLYKAISSAVKRGVDVTSYVSFGYNDPGEQMPGQGGINEVFAARLYSELSPVEKERLHVYWYVAKDQRRPLHHTLKQRDCHIKLLIVDGRVGIQGSGNMDTQSWCHSQEINIMIDSPEICKVWREGIERNQNTAEFGLGSPDDGAWRDEHGNKAEFATPVSSGPQAWVSGFIGMAKKAQEKGGFG